MTDDDLELRRPGINAPRVKPPLREGSTRWLAAVVRCRQFWQKTHNDSKTVGALENLGFSNDDAVGVFKFAKDRGLLK